MASIRAARRDSTGLPLRWEESVDAVSKTDIESRNIAESEDHVLNEGHSRYFDSDT